MLPTVSKDIHMQVNPDVIRVHPVDPAIWQDEEAYLRRRLTHELHTLRERITGFPQEDSLSRNLNLWLESFTNGVRLQELAGERAPLARVLERYTTYLQRFLRTPIPPFVPFDEEVLLGSDGHSYGKKFLTVYLYHETPELRKRSPMEPANEARFTVTRHLFAEEFVKWLKDRNGLLQSHELEADYQSLNNQGRLPPLPFPFQVELEAEEEMIAQAIAAVENIVPFAQELFDQHQARMNHLDAEENARIEAAQAALQQAQQAFFRELDVVKNRIQQEENNVHRNAQNILQLQRNIEQAEEANRQIQQGIQKIQEAFDRQERDSMKGLLQFGGSLVLSLAVTLTITYFAPGFSLSPIQGGGMLKYTNFF